MSVGCSRHEVMRIWQKRRQKADKMTEESREGMEDLSNKKHVSYLLMP